MKITKTKTRFEHPSLQFEPPPDSKEAKHLEALKVLFGWDAMSLTPEQKATFLLFIKKWAHLFPLNNSRIGYIKGYVYDIKLESNSKPVWASPYKTSPKALTDEVKPLTSFTSFFGQFQYKRLPFGLTTLLPFSSA